jgi:NAD(P)-dependent dehydrogenase (short-subunit alcohol dehydrogenase family)/acyl dehydratase
VTRPLRIGSEQLQRFADASGDRNPLHTDAAFARATPYGRCIVHGALVTVAALAVVDGDRLQHVNGVHVQFKDPVFPEEDYATSLLEADSERVRIEVAREGRVAAAISCTLGAGALPARVATRRQVDLRSSSTRLTVEALAAGERTLDEPYGADVDALCRLAEELGSGRVPRHVLLWLAAGSYTVGMVAPGENALFVGARMERSSSERAGALTGSVTIVDDRTGLVNLDVLLHEQDASARMELQTFLRPPVPPPDRASIGRYLTPSHALGGRTILVLGGSRGLGAAVAGALATQGATVAVGFAESIAHVERLQSGFGADTIQPLRFDASDPADVRRAVTTLRDRTAVLDGVVLCAAPPLYETSLYPDASESTLEFVHQSIAMTLLPLAESLPLLARDGWLVVLSSSAVENPPEPWPHYVIAKSALEGIAAYCRRITGARVLVARPPMMWTDSTNTPLARLGAVPKEQVAAAIVRWALGEGPADDVLVAAEIAAERPGV